MPTPPSSRTPGHADRTAARRLGLVTPRTLLRAVSTTEAVTWGLLLAGMAGERLLGGPDALVSIAGSLHGTAFLAYLGCILVLRIDRRWSWRMLLAGAIASVPPFATLLFDRIAQRRGALDGPWRLSPHSLARKGDDEESRTVPERAAAWAIRHPLTLIACTAAVFTLILTGSLSGSLRSPH